MDGGSGGSSGSSLDRKSEGPEFDSLCEVGFLRFPVLPKGWGTVSDDIFRISGFHKN